MGSGRPSAPGMWSGSPPGEVSARDADGTAAPASPEDVEGPSPEDAGDAGAGAGSEAGSAARTGSAELGAAGGGA